MLTCFSCFFPQGSCFLGGLALCLVRLTYGVPVLDLLTVPLHTLEAGMATTVSSVPVQLCPTWGGAGDLMLVPQDFREGHPLWVSGHL